MTKVLKFIIFILLPVAWLPVTIWKTVYSLLYQWMYWAQDNYDESKKVMDTALDETWFKK